jgi:hypothetical protein
MNSYLFRAKRPLFLIVMMTFLGTTSPATGQQMTESLACLDGASLTRVEGTSTLLFRVGSILAVSGTHAYASDLTEPFIAVVDISNPQFPIDVGQITTPGSVSALAASDEFLLAAIPGEGLIRYDLSDPSAPVEDLTLSMTSPLVDMILEGDIVFLALGDQGVGAVTMAVPGFLLPLPGFSTGGRVTSVAYDNGLLLATDPTNGLLVLDAANPSNLGFLSATPFEVEARTVSTGFGRAVVGGRPADNAWSTIGLYDLADPEHPALLASRTFQHSYPRGPYSVLHSVDCFLVVQGGLSNGSEFNYPADFVFDGQDLLVSGSSSTMGNRQVALTDDWLVGLNRTRVSVARAGILSPEPFAWEQSRGGRAVAQGNLVYRTAAPGLKILDITDPLAPLELSELEMAAESIEKPVAAYASQIYVAHTQVGIMVIDAGDPANPTVSDLIPTQRSTRGLLQDGGFLYGVAGTNGFSVYDLATPETPVLRGSVFSTGDTTWRPAMAKWGSKVFVSGYPGGVWVYDVSNPDQPELVDQFGLDLVLALAFSGDGRLLVGHPTGIGLATYEEDAEGNWVLLGKDRHLEVSSILVDRDVAYAVRDNLIKLYDLAPGGQPQEFVSLAFNVAAGDLVLLEDAVYWAGGGVNRIGATFPKLCTSGLSAVRVETPSGARMLAAPWPNPFNPRTTLSFSLPQSGHARLSVYDLLGHRVRTLWDGPAPVGETKVTWDGTDGRGRNVAAGMYMVRLLVGERTETRKVALLK